MRNCSAARTDLGENNIKSTERTIFALCTNSTFGRGQSQLLLSLCLIVCLFVSCSCSRTKASASILPQSKTFQRAHCIADANQRIKGMLQADKEGLMPTSKPLTTITGDSPASLAQCKTKWRRAARYHNMAALSRDGHCLVAKNKKRRKNENGGKRACFYDPAKESYFLFAKIIHDKNCVDCVGK